MSQIEINLQIELTIILVYQETILQLTLLDRDCRKWVSYLCKSLRFVYAFYRVNQRAFLHFMPILQLTIEGPNF